MTAQKKTILNGRVDKMWSIFPRDYYSAVKRNEALTRATTWMGLENIMLSESCQTHIDNYCMILFRTHAEQTSS